MGERLYMALKNKNATGKERRVTVKRRERLLVAVASRVTCLDPLLA